MVWSPSAQALIRPRAAVSPKGGRGAAARVRGPGPRPDMTTSLATTLPEPAPCVGELVHVRSRRWLVEEIVDAADPGGSPRVRLACADDDAPGQSLEVFWNYAREAEARTLDLIDRSLARQGAPPEAVRRRLLAAAPGDIEALLPQLEPRAEELAAIAVDRLHRRGEQEARSLREILDRQRARIRDELRRHDERSGQLALAFSPEEQRQLDADVRAWRRRLTQFDEDLEREPDRIRAFYEVRARRVEPVGLVYLWPETN